MIIEKDNIPPQEILRYRLMMLVMEFSSVNKTIAKKVEIVKNDDYNIMYIEFIDGRRVHTPICIDDGLIAKFSIDLDKIQTDINSILKGTYNEENDGL
jgi:hypothetical protein